MKRITAALLILFFSGFVLPYNTRAGEREDRMQKIADSLAEIEMMGGDRLGYSGEILDFLESIYKIKPAVKNYRRYLYGSNRWRERKIDGYSLLSGGLAIRESLQTETIRPADYKAGDVVISELTGPVIKSHPFKEMTGKKKVTLFELDKYCPGDFYYLHFNSMSGSLNFFDYLGNVGGAVYKRFTPQSVDFMLKEKMLMQLGLKENKVARKFYDLVIKEMLMTGSDPFFIEGTDVTLIFKLKHDSVFNATVSGYRKSFEKDFGAVTEEMTIAGVKTSHLYTKDGRINSYLAYTDPDTALISNSAKGLETVLMAASRKHASMAEADDYLYMRTIYPTDAGEDCFLYLSDSFIRRLTGPELRIKEARRMNEALRLARLEKFIIFYYQLNNKYPESMEDIYKFFETAANPSSGEHEKERIRRDIRNVFEGLGFYQNSFTAYSKIYGRQNFMKPNIDTELKYATKEEAENYKIFVEDYSRFWVEYFDPIGVRLKLDDGITIQTCILPLINNSIYNQLAMVTGGAPLKLHTGNSIDGEIFGICLKINTEILPALMSLGTGVDIGKNANLLGNLNNEVQLHMLDTNPLVDFNSSETLNYFIQNGFEKNDVAIGLIAWSLFHPLRLSVPLKKTVDIRYFTDFFNRSFMMRRSREVNYEMYNYEYKSCNITVAKICLFNTLTFRVYYSVWNNNLEITTTEDYMKRIIDSGKKAAEAQNETGNILALYRPAQMKLERDTYTATMLETACEASFGNFGTIRLLNELFHGEKDIARKSLENFGFKAVCPMEGIYSVDPKTGKVSNSVFGSIDSPSIKPGEIRSDALTRFFSTQEIKLKFEFTKEGIKTEIRTK